MTACGGARGWGCQSFSGPADVGTNQPERSALRVFQERVDPNLRERYRGSSRRCVSLQVHPLRFNAGCLREQFCCWGHLQDPVRVGLVLSAHSQGGHVRAAKGSEQTTASSLAGKAETIAGVAHSECSVILARMSTAWKRSMSCMHAGQQGRSKQGN